MVSFCQIIRNSIISLVDEMRIYNWIMDDVDVDIYLYFLMKAGWFQGLFFYDVVVENNPIHS